MPKPFLRSPYNYDRDQASLVSGIFCPPEESMTQQQFKEDADINVIVERFGLTGQLPSQNRMPVSGDFSQVTDFQTALNLVTQAREGFLEFPADIRDRFNNDPQRMLNFLADPNNKDEAIKLGLVNKPVPAQRTPIDAIDELAAALKPPQGSK